ncbi:PDZ domain-containing protein 4 isoform X1 [Alligator mississippiensis]|uniref:PDZ domain-containing protein 4 n=1 Tax=Alligator mississippiensis TaxID=8496 RepID=A0A151NDM0_ALLMI|nr:PDZ domain-containing protein 4 isoform X1 [Alligator mississippiensis]KYO34886.1 PDZ domain-containing protein 4 [Alligator mississippiensis]
MGCNMCVVEKPEEQYKVMLQVHGKELSGPGLEVLRGAKEPLVIQVLRRSPRETRGRPGSGLPPPTPPVLALPPTAPLPLPPGPGLVDSGTQTDISFERLLARGWRPPPDITSLGHEYYDPVELMEGVVPETERTEELEYEEVELYKPSHRDKLGLMVCYRTDDEDDVGIYVGEVNPNSIAARDGRIREGDRIVQINGVEVHDREEAVAILTHEQRTNISLLLARPEAELSKHWKDSDREDFLDDFGSDPEDEARPRPPRAAPGQPQMATPALPLPPPAAPPALGEPDSGVGRTDESTRNEESSEHDLLGDEPPSGTGTPALQRRGEPLPDAVVPPPSPPATPGLTPEEAERYRELLELRGHLQNGNQGPPLYRGVPGGLDVNRNEVALLEEELRHLEFKCRNILRAQKMQQLRERCLKAWLLEDGGPGGYEVSLGGPPHALADITELPESAYNTGESCRSTPQLESPLRQPPMGNLNRPPGPPKTRRPSEARPTKRSPREASPSRLGRKDNMAVVASAPPGLVPLCASEALPGVGRGGEWRGKGAKRPVRDRLLKARALKIREERSGMTTDDDAMSELKLGRYWSREERKQHLARAREQRRRRELMLQSRLEAAGASPETSAVALGHRKTLRKRSRRILDNWLTIQEMLAHGSRGADGRRLYNPLLSVTTV